METLTINISTIHGNFDFVISKIPYTDNVIIQSECLFGEYKFEPDFIYHHGKLITKFVSVYQSSPEIHLFDWDDENFVFDFSSVDTIDLNKFEEIINEILTEFN